MYSVKNNGTYKGDGAYKGDEAYKGGRRYKDEVDGGGYKGRDGRSSNESILRYSKFLNDSNRMVHIYDRNSVMDKPRGGLLNRESRAPGQKFKNNEIPGGLKAFVDDDESVSPPGWPSLNSSAGLSQSDSDEGLSDSLGSSSSFLSGIDGSSLSNSSRNSPLSSPKLGRFGNHYQSAELLKNPILINCNESDFDYDYDSLIPDLFETNKAKSEDKKKQQALQKVDAAELAERRRILGEPPCLRHDLQRPNIKMVISKVRPKDFLLVDSLRFDSACAELQLFNCRRLREMLDGSDVNLISSVYNLWFREEIKVVKSLSSTDASSNIEKTVVERPVIRVLGASRYDVEQVMAEMDVELKIIRGEVERCEEEINKKNKESRLCVKELNNLYDEIEALRTAEVSMAEILLEWKAILAIDENIINCRDLIIEWLCCSGNAEYLSLQRKFNSLIAGLRSGIQRLGDIINVDAKDDNKGRTGLHYASQNLSNMLLEFIRYGANLDIQDDDGNTALHLALSGGLASNAILLLKAGAQINLVNKNGETPAALAKKNGFSSNLLQTLINQDEFSVSCLIRSADADVVWNDRSNRKFNDRENARKKIDERLEKIHGLNRSRAADGTFLMQETLAPQHFIDIAQKGPGSVAQTYKLNDQRSSVNKNVVSPQSGSTSNLARENTDSNEFMSISLD
ncbi:ankyrin repeat domain-containing protein [Paraburkholderia bonniea]|uniref:ankyrin repeat domain-containing protein n=1 Tax=Paraburkholderia bonniea TaxID=2152891 RepID=UPI002572CD9B|nr:ankyrin repeat domain-containing protein [Paraburkholderia bonniea]WJF90364.1 ankyrin repeat domain-containing protein [Paraburkholderia bonniea]WJF93679.1 ankyrin repeat domain-containing protein [Paraburkholderia bonniea]